MAQYFRKLLTAFVALAVCGCARESRNLNEVNREVYMRAIDARANAELQNKEDRVKKRIFVKGLLDLMEAHKDDLFPLKEVTEMPPYRGDDRELCFYEEIKSEIIKYYNRKLVTESKLTFLKFLENTKMLYKIIKQKEKSDV